MSSDSSCSKVICPVDGTEMEPFYIIEGAYRCPKCGIIDPAPYINSSQPSVKQEDE